MKKIDLTNSRYQILLTAIFFALSIFILSFIVNRDLDKNFEKNWWVVSFENRSENSADFTLENHSDIEEFSFVITLDGVVFQNQKILIHTGEKKTFTFDPITYEHDLVINIETAAGEKKSIYRKKEQQPNQE